MGYLSDVRFSTTKDGYREFRSHIPDEVLGAYGWMFSSDGAPLEFDEDGNSVVFGWNQIKWYDGYEEVDAVMDAYRKVREHGVEPICYIRVGEGYDDIEEDGSYNAENGDLPRYLGVERTIYTF